MTALAVYVTHPLVAPIREALRNRLNLFAVLEFPTLKDYKRIELRDHELPQGILKFGGNRDRVYFCQYSPESSPPIFGKSSPVVFTRTMPPE